MNPGRRQLGKVDPSFFIIGVGASAGGLGAIKQLIAQADDSFPHSFVIIQHISPDHKSLMTEILARETHLQVTEVTDDMPVRPGFIYLIPPKTNVVIQGTLDDTQPAQEFAERDPVAEGLRFSLVAPSPRPQLNLPIDVFFHSLAEAVGDRAIAIVLSGTGTDGSRGLRAVKDMDGFVAVQEPSTADFDGMPIAAISTNLVDLISAPDAMVAEITRYIGLREAGLFDIEEFFRGHEVLLEELLQEVSAASQIDFTQYKKPTLKRRIARRIALNHCVSLEDYKEFVEDNPAETEILHREFLVGVTNFFRDRPAWNDIIVNVIPKLYEQGDPSEPVKVWSVGCSTGEEAYTIAMLLEAYRLENGIARDFRIFATDVNQDAIRAAKDGVYSDSVLDEVPPAYRDGDFMSFHGGTFHIKNKLRNRVIFNTHNVLEEPPYINTDLIICRNMLIYLGSDMQKRVLALFSFSLRDQGFLFLGASENVTHQSVKFQALVSSSRIYQNQRPNHRGGVGAALGTLRSTTSSPLPRLRRLATREPQRKSNTLGPILEAALANVEGCVLILDEGGTVLETIGNYRDFVELPDKAFSANVFDLLHERLKSAVSLLLRRAEAEGSAQSLGTKCSFGDRIEVVDVFCQKTEWETQPIAYSVMLRKADVITAPPISDALAADVSTAEHSTIMRLEGEIESLREMLTVTTEDLGVSNEELQTANEELTVSNEELQANNEEMQSINEELHTVNAENAEKILQLENAQADIENLLNTTDLAVIFLDEDLHIRRFNPAFTRYVGLKGSDVGRPLSVFASNFEQAAFVDLLKDIKSIKVDSDEVHRELPLVDGSWAFVRIRPYDVADADTYGGVAVTIIDVSQSRRLQEEVREQRDRLQGLIEAESAGYWDWDLITNYEYLSPRFKEMLGYAEHEMENSPESWQGLIHPEDMLTVQKNFEKHIATKGAHPYDQEVRFTHNSGRTLWINCRGRVTEWGDNGEALRMLGVHIDITTLKERELALMQKTDDIIGFNRSSVHNLLQPLTTFEHGITVLKDDIAEGDELAAQESLDILAGVSERLQERVANLGDYLNLFSGDLQHENLDLNTIIAGCRTDLATRIQQAHARFHVEQLPSIFGHHGLISSLFANLLNASLKSRREDRPCEISISGGSLPGNWVMVRISDTGHGINPALRDKLFELFFVPNDNLSYFGDGVALPMCKRIVDEHGGTIGFVDQPNQGTTVELTLPAAKP